MLSLGQLYTDTNTNDDDDDNNNDTNNDDKDTWQTDHDCISSLPCMSNEPKSKPHYTVAGWSFERKTYTW